MPKKTTIHDIASYVGVGAGTVSRVINNHPSVSEKTRSKVLKAMDKLGYRPSFAAQSLRSQRSKIIGFLTDQVATTPYAVDIIRGAQNEAWSHKKVLMVLNTGEAMENAQSAVELLLERDVEGIIFAAMWHREVDLPLNLHEVPTVLANCYTTSAQLPCTVPDEVNGGYTATRHLIDKGHRRIALVNLPVDIPAGEGRHEGYRQVLEEAGIPYDPTLVSDDENNSEMGYHHTHRLLALEDAPTAIFAGTDNIAVGVYDAVKEAGRRIPDDVAVVGFDNQESIAMSLRPALTTIQLPHYEMGQWALDYLIGEETAHDPLIYAQLPCPIVERGST